MRTTYLLAAAALMLATSCQGDQNADPTVEQTQSIRDQAREEAGNVRFVVDKSERKLRVYYGNELIGMHDVAIGASKWETPTGRWTFDRVDLNPEWIPPDSPWAEGESPEPPGDPENPMGRARLVFDMPYTIHGTDDLTSLGKAASHGSIRIANPDAIFLAELLLKAGGAWEGEHWFRGMTQNRAKEFQVELPYDIPMEVRE